MKASTVFSCNYRDKDQVIALAKRFGKGQTVFKHPDRDNYNITHSSRTDRLKGCAIVFQT